MIVVAWTAINAAASAVGEGFGSIGEGFGQMFAEMMRELISVAQQLEQDQPK